MKKTSLLLVFGLIQFLNLRAQGTFKVKCITEPTFLTVNGVTKLVDTNYISFKTHYPDFDTFAINDGMWEQKKKILADFKPDSNYVISLGCCANTEIFPARMLIADYWVLKVDDEPMADSIYKSKAYGHNKFIIELNEGDESDSIYAWNATAVCMAEVKLMDQNAWYMGQPDDCFYSSSNKTIQFFKLKTQDTSIKSEDDMSLYILEYVMENKISVLAEVTFRFFDWDEYRIVYDAKQKSVMIRREG